MPVEFLALKCPNCGGSLEVYPDRNNFNCGYCGSSISAMRRGETITLSPDEVVQSIAKATDRTAAELALRRIPLEIKETQNELDYQRSTYLQYKDSYETFDSNGRVYVIQEELKRLNSVLILMTFGGPVIFFPFLYAVLVEPTGNPLYALYIIVPVLLSLVYMIWKHQSNKRDNEVIVKENVNRARRNRELRAEAKATLKASYDEVKAKCEGLEAKLEMLKKKLAECQEIVNS